MKKINIFYLFLYSIIFDYLKAFLYSDYPIHSYCYKKKQFFKLRTFYATKNLLELLTENIHIHISILHYPYPYGLFGIHIL